MIYGTVKSLPRNTTIKQERILSQYINEYGYASVCLCKNNKMKKHSVHRLVAFMFIPNPDNKPDVDHLNTIRDDNRAENLKWVTKKENSNNPITLERIRKIDRTVIERHNPIVCVETNTIYKNAGEANKQTGIDQSAIIKCCRGKRKTAGKYHWKYKD